MQCVSFTVINHCSVLKSNKKYTNVKLWSKIEIYTALEI